MTRGILKDRSLLVDVGEVRRINDELKQLGVPARVWYRINHWIGRIERRRIRLREGTNAGQVI